MVVIVEGLDGTGKTTLTKRFADKYKFDYVKGSYTNSDDEKLERLKTLLSQIFDVKKNYIYDRCTIIDDFVYNFLDKKEPRFKEYIDIIKSILNHCKIIHLIIEEKERNKRFLNRGDDYITSDMIETISKNYVKFYKDMGISLNVYALSNDVDKDIENIYKLIK